MDAMDEFERPSLLHTKSDTHIFRNRNGPVRKKSPPRGPISGKATPADGEMTPDLPDTGKRHISFKHVCRAMRSGGGASRSPD